jgi:hypothetical protein
MSHFLPLFPLNLVAFPTENLNLHIFEPRYVELVNDCLEGNKIFGIPAFVNGKLMPHGTEMKIVKVEKRYDDGRFDIKTRGIRPFKIETFENLCAGKQYASGLVQPLEDLSIGSTPAMFGLVDRIKKLYQILQTSFQFDTSVPYFSYLVGHKIGLDIEEEYSLLLLRTEAERQVFLIQHIERTFPIVLNMERTKERIKMNGHFKNLDPLNF